ncbi:MAG: hypothetical protein QNJ53_26000 [Pleurocapsa sp. MO_192.B19]|nr:hypothetical protein [Pleurocapsa sp. MO_192.B19]
MDSKRPEVKHLTELTGKEPDLMDQVLMYQPPLVQRQVRKLVRMSGIKQDDPYFLILLSCRINQILLENAPNSLEKSLDNYFQRVLNFQGDRLEQHRQVALDISIAKLNNAIAKTLEDNGIESKKGFFKSLVWIRLVNAISTATALSVGFASGWSFDKAVLAKANTVNLSPTEIGLLEWAQSKEGKFAKDLLDWNEDLLGQECQKKVSSLNVTIEIGSAKATSGYCFVWTEPPRERSFN